MTSSHLLSWPPKILAPVSLFNWKQINWVEPTQSLERGKTTRFSVGRKKSRDMGHSGTAQLAEWEELCLDQATVTSSQPCQFLAAAPVVFLLEERHNTCTSLKYSPPELLRAIILNKECVSPTALQWPHQCFTWKVLTENFNRSVSLCIPDLLIPLF